MHRSTAVRDLLRSTARRASGSYKRVVLPARGAVVQTPQEDMGFWVPYAGIVTGFAIALALRQLNPPEKTYLEKWLEINAANEAANASKQGSNGAK